MNNYQKYLKFCKNHKRNQVDDFFDALAKEFNVTEGTTYQIWYAEQRSWFKPEMIDELIRLDNPEVPGFRPNLGSGEFDWEDGKFVPENNFYLKRN